jgi:hypothetical protein
MPTAFLVEPQKPLDPGDIRLLGLPGVMQDAEHFSHLVEELGAGGNVGIHDWMFRAVCAVLDSVS